MTNEVSLGCLVFSSIRYKGDRAVTEFREFFLYNFLLGLESQTVCHLEKIILAFITNFRTSSSRMRRR